MKIDKIVVVLVILAVMSSIFISYQFSGLLFSYFFSFILVIIHAFFVRKVSKNDLILVMSISFLLILTAVYNIREPWFSIVDFFQSFLPLMLVFLVLIFTVNLSKFLSTHTYLVIINSFFWLVIILQFVQFALFQFDRVIVFNTESLSLVSDRYHALRTSDGFYRPTAIFSEPSLLSIALFNLFTISLILQRASFFRINVYLIAQLFTFSLTGIFAIIISIILIQIKHRKIGLKTFFLLPLVLSITYFLLPHSNFSFIFSRLVRLFQGSDTSTFIRFVHSLQVNRIAFQEVPLLGTGLGQDDRFSLYYGITNFYDSTIGNRFNNLPQYFLATFGVVGGAIFIFLFCLILISKIKTHYFHRDKNLLLLIGFILFNMITHGYFISTLFWVNLSLVILAIRVSQLPKAVDTCS